MSITSIFTFSKSPGVSASLIDIVGASKLAAFDSESLSLQPKNEISKKDKRIYLKVFKGFINYYILYLYSLCTLLTQKKTTYFIILFQYSQFLLHSQQLH